MIVGTSVGAINAAFLGSVAHLPAGEAVARGRELWLDVGVKDVIKPIVGLQAARTGLRYAGAVAGLPGARLEALLDPEPLAQTLDSWIDWDALHRNLSDGTADAVAVVGTSALSATSVLFTEGLERNPRSSHEISFRPHPALTAARQRLGRDPDPVPGGADRRAGGCGRLVPRRRHPPEHTDQARSGAEVFAAEIEGASALRSPDLAVIGRLLGGVSEPHGELMSYLLFLPQFTEAIIEIGAADAREWLASPPGEDGPWMTAPIEVREVDA